MGSGADGDRVYEQEVARPREGEFKKNKEGGRGPSCGGEEPKRKTREGANATTAPPRRIALGNSEG